MENCHFCLEIEHKSRILGETKNTITLLSNPSLMKGYCLVIPRKHVESLAELNKKERDDLFEQVVSVQEKLLRKIRVYYLGQNYRPFQKQDNLEVNYLYTPLQPRELFDELYEKDQIHEKKIFKVLNQKELDETKKLILS